jgi:protoporphyrin/coproporphyrin ferrochelatase
MTKIGVLLVNIGTPDDPSVRSVRRYLREFLSDPRMLDMPGFLRFMLLNGIILPFRARQSAKLYQAIWTKAGSPLQVYSNALSDKLTKALGPDYVVVQGMRYGDPGIKTALKKLDGVSKLIVLPLFPQYSSAATGSVIEAVLNEIKSGWNFPEIRVVNQFYDHPGFIAAYAGLIKTHHQADFTLFSYHGLPERHVEKSGCSQGCDKRKACPAISDANAFCYRAQCFETTRLLAKALNLKSSAYQTAFQSRLGRIPWIKPYTEDVLPNLIKQGVKQINVVCPAFTVDCLETLEEIGIRAKTRWRELGGESLTLIPCLNDDPNWVVAIRDMIIKQGS